MKYEYSIMYDSIKIIVNEYKIFIPLISKTIHSMTASYLYMLLTFQIGRIISGIWINIFQNKLKSKNRQMKSYEYFQLNIYFFCIVSKISQFKLICILI